MLYSRLPKFEIILGSASPRRHQFLRELQIPFTVRVSTLEETYPTHLQGSEITDFLARQKASALSTELKENQILITCDTIVCLNDDVLGKPLSKEQAREMLHLLSGKTHLVHSSIALTMTTTQIVDSETTKVTFSTLSEEEIDFYVSRFSPLDKAGAYGIQDWIGSIGVSRIEGSYNNVIGLPTRLLFKHLSDLTKM